MTGHITSDKTSTRQIGYFRKQLGPSEIKSGDRMERSQENGWSGRASLRRLWEGARCVKTWERVHSRRGDEKCKGLEVRSQRKLNFGGSEKNGPSAFSRVSKADGV